MWGLKMRREDLTEPCGQVKEFEFCLESTRQPLGVLNRRLIWFASWKDQLAALGQVHHSGGREEARRPGGGYPLETVTTRPQLFLPPVLEVRHNGAHASIVTEFASTNI